MNDLIESANVVVMGAELMAEMSVDELALSRRNLYLLDVIENSTLSPQLEAEYWNEYVMNCDLMGITTPEIVS